MQEFYNECEDKFHDECGVVGVYLNPEDEKIKAGKKNAAVLSYYALVSLQHRGQESAGLCVSDGENLKIHKAMGLVSDGAWMETIASRNITSHCYDEAEFNAIFSKIVTTYVPLFRDFCETMKNKKNEQ